MGLGHPVPPDPSRVYLLAKMADDLPSVVRIQAVNVSSNHIYTNDNVSDKILMIWLCFHGNSLDEDP